MENIMQNEAAIIPNKAKNTLAIIGFLLMLTGPFALCISHLVTRLFGYITTIAADVIFITASILPGIGAILCIIALFRRKKTGKLGRTLSIVTVIMCNPIFYLIYVFYCSVVSSTLADLPWM